MADGAFPSLVSKDTAVNAAGNPIYTQLTDGTTVISVTGNALDVNVDNTVTVTPSGTVNVDIQDSWAGLTGGGTEAGVLRVTIANDSTGLLSVDDNGSSLTVDFLGQLIDDTGFTPETSTVVAAGFFADETAPDSVTEGDIGAARMTLDRKQLMVIVDKSTDSNRLVVNSNGSINVNVTSAAITGEVHSYDTATFAGGVGSTDNHDYTVTNTMLIKSIIVAASGNVKFELQAGPLASLATYAVGFLNDRQGDTKQIFFDPPIEVPNTSTGTVRIIRTNRQGTAQDVYSTIIGIDA